MQRCQDHSNTLFVPRGVFVHRPRRRDWEMRTSVQSWRASSLLPERPEDMPALWINSNQRNARMCCKAQPARIMYSRVAHQLCWPASVCISLQGIKTEVHRRFRMPYIDAFTSVKAKYSMK